MKLFFVIILFSLIAVNVSALDFWQHPEMAEKNSLFAGGFAAQFIVKNVKFDFYHPEFYLDYMLPVGLPFSAGAFVNSLGPFIFSAGLRPAYHINFDNENLDVYVLYIANLIFTKEPGPEKILLEFGGRIGFRWRFGPYFCACVETGFKLQTVYFGIAIKLH